MGRLGRQKLARPVAWNPETVEHNGGGSGEGEPALRQNTGRLPVDQPGIVGEQVVEVTSRSTYSVPAVCLS